MKILLWNIEGWEISARGHSVGILMGVRTINLEVENWEHGAYYVG
jgi:hypothetical protein